MAEPGSDEYWQKVEKDIECPGPHRLRLIAAGTVPEIIASLQRVITDLRSDLADGVTNYHMVWDLTPPQTGTEEYNAEMAKPVQPDAEIRALVEKRRAAGLVCHCNDPECPTLACECGDKSCRVCGVCPP